MNHRIACPECAASLRLVEDLLGKKVQCPRCRLHFIAELPEPVAESAISEGPNYRADNARRNGLLDPDDDFPTHPTSSRAGVWIGVLISLCVGLVGLVGYLLITRNQQPAPIAMAPQEMAKIEINAAPNPAPQPFAAPPEEGVDPLAPFRGPNPGAPAEGEQVTLSNPRFQRDGFGPFEKLCVDYRFNDRGGLAPRVGLTMILKSGNRTSEATLFGLINDSGTIALDSFGLQKIPSGTQIWLAEGFGLGMGGLGGRFGPQPKRISNVVTVP